MTAPGRVPGFPREGRFALGTASLFIVCLSVFAVADDRGEPTDAVLPRSATPTFVGTGEAGTGTLGLRVGYYDQDDSGVGNPFLDESSDVVETIFIGDYDVSDRLSAWGLFSFDIVSSASIARLDNYPEQTGASGDYYVGLDAGLGYELAMDRRVGGFVSGSFERDYYSFGFGGNTSADFFDANTTLGLSATYYYDTIDVIRFDGSENEGTDDRHSLSLTASWRQVLDRKTFGEWGVHFSHQTGFLETSYNGVVIEEPGTRPPFPFDNGAEGFEIREAFPQHRERGAVSARLRRLLFPSTSLELGGRYALDSWESDAFDVETTVRQSLFSDALVVRARYRYYEQDASQYYDIDLQSSDPTPRFRTQDSDFSGYHAHTLGLKLDWAASEKLRLDVGVDYTFRSDDLDFVFGSVGITRSFVAPESWRWTP